MRITLAHTIAAACILFPGAGGLAGSGAPGAAAMLAVSDLPANPQEIVWERLPTLPATRVTLFRGLENASAFCHHPTIAWRNGRFFAAWSNGDRDEDASRQRVLYSTSANGRDWTTPTRLAEGIPEMAYTPCGFWFRGDEIFALAALRRSRDAQPGPVNRTLIAFRWNSERGEFERHQVIASDFFATDAPRLAPDGQWLMLGKSASGVATDLSIDKVALGGVRSLDHWEMAEYSGMKSSAHDSFWYETPGRGLAAILAAGQPPDRFLLKVESTDSGRSWSAPTWTNFPDGDSRFAGMRLSTGLYVLLSNPNPSRYRIPLSLAVSRDGRSYSGMANVRIEQTNKRYSGHAKAPGYQYVRAIEHEGNLWAIYSVNKEDVEVSVIPFSAIDRLATTPQRYPSAPEDAIVVDNGTPGFTTEGPWRIERTAPGYHGDDYAALPPNTVGAAIWTATAAADGAHRLYLRWATTGFSQRSPMEDIVPVEIRYPHGLDTTSVDESRYGGTWVHLKTLLLRKGDPLTVKIMGGGDGIVVADAIKLVRCVPQ